MSFNESTVDTNVLAPSLVVLPFDASLLNEFTADTNSQDTAEATKEAVDSFVSMVNQEVQRQLESKATQNHVAGNHVEAPKTDEAWKTFLN
ncbi:hypothetical protein QS422_05985 [Staphylococcus pseudintermedius]|nr:hypothetical protein QS422_05985 [Staphylococcus pseudintermedius]